MFDLLHRLGGTHGIIRQSEFFLYSKLDRDAVTRCLERGYDFPEITGWIRAVKSDFKLVKEIEASCERIYRDASGPERPLPLVVVLQSCEMRVTGLNNWNCN